MYLTLLLILSFLASGMAVVIFISFVFSSEDNNPYFGRTEKQSCPSVSRFYKLKYSLKSTSRNMSRTMIINSSVYPIIRHLFFVTSTSRSVTTRHHNTSQIILTLCVVVPISFKDPMCQHVINKLCFRGSLFSSLDITSLDIWSSAPLYVHECFHSYHFTSRDASVNVERPAL